MTTPVSNTRPVAVTRPAASAPATNAPAVNTPAKPAATGDSLALSASAKATAPQKTVIIDGKEFELRETAKRQWNTFDKVATWGGTGIGGVAGIFVGAFCAIGVNFSGALTPASCLAWAIGWAVTAGAGYLAGRGVSKVGNAVGGLFDGK